MAAPGHLQRGLHLPLISCRHVALDRGEAALGVAATHCEEEAVEHVQAEVGAPLVHVRQVNPAVETRVISERIKKKKVTVLFTALLNCTELLCHCCKSKVDKF